MKLFLVLISVLTLTSANAMEINGAGASFPYPIYTKWFQEYNKVDKDAKFNYQAIGSGGGIRQLIKQTVDFGASDAPMKAKDEKKAAWKVHHIPTVIGAVAVGYNLKDLKGLKLTGEVLANIYMGKVTKWNDPAITALNKGLKLPNKPILPVYRADGSGTTAIYTDYLSKVNTAWKSEIGSGKAVQWPAGIGAKGNSGVTGVIKQRYGSIGYINYSYAVQNKITTVALKNKKGEFVTPSIESTSLAAAKLKDFSNVKVSITDSEGSGSYPISGFTYILLPENKNEKITKLKEFLKWALTTGQKYAAELYYAPLPKVLAKKMEVKVTK